MRRALLTSLVLLGLAGCGKASEDRQYKWNDLMLITSFTAKSTCTCLFVMNRDETYCRTWTKESPAVASWTADMKAKTVSSSALVFWGARAHFVSEHAGCVLE